MDDQIICHQCGGNGYVKVRFEAEQAIEQCKVCDSQGELLQDKHYHQTWTEGVSNDNYLRSITGHLSTPKVLKTTKFIAGNPVVDVKKGEEPPF